MTPEQNRSSPPPPPSPTPARTIIDARSVISRSVDDGRRRIVARRLVASARLRSIAIGVTGLRAAGITGPRSIGSCLPRRAGAEVAGDRISAASIPRSPRTIRRCNPVTRTVASGRNGRNDLGVRSRSAAQIDGGGDRGRPCARGREPGPGRLAPAWLGHLVGSRPVPVPTRLRADLLSMSWRCYGRGRNDAQRRAERLEMERHDEILLADNRPAPGQRPGNARVNPISVTNLRPKFRPLRMKKI